jgi:dihydrofolate reductase
VLVTELIGSATDDFEAVAESKLRTTRQKGGGQMRKLTVNTFLTVDGVMQAPGGPEEDPTGGFTHGGWSVNYWDEAMGQRMGEFMGKPFDLLLGRKTYDIFAAHWPHSDEPGAAELNSATKHVASRTLDKVEWANSILIEGDVPEYVTKLKQEDGPEIQVHGSGDLIQTLLEHDLVDELGLWVFPLVLGSGKRLFGDGAIPAGLKLVDSKTFSTGVIMARYERAGDIEYGSFALEEPTEAEVQRRQELS